MSTASTLIPAERIERRILLVRGQASDHPTAIATS